MKQYKRILACIDDFERDEQLLRYIETLVQLADTEEIHFVYVSEDLWRSPYPSIASFSAMRHDSIIPPVPDMPTHRMPVVPPVPEIHMEELKVRLQVLINSFVENNPKCVIKTHVVEGHPLYEILDYALTRNIDLITMRSGFGELSDKGSKAIVARRIARKSTCSVLTIPENSLFKTPNILVPVRDSECSQNAFVEACAIAGATGGMVEALNVYQVYSHYMIAGIPINDHLGNLEKYAGMETESLLSRVPIPNVEIRRHFIPDFNTDPVQVIKKRIQECQANLVVIGARGRTGAAGVLLGTVTEQLIQAASTPVLAVKKKGECIGLLKAILEVMGIGNHPTNVETRA